jgi:hypothetical protein
MEGNGESSFTHKKIKCFYHRDTGEDRVRLGNTDRVDAAYFLLKLEPPPRRT